MDRIKDFSLAHFKRTVSAYFGKETAEVTLSITLTLLFRSVGALIFGLLSDRS